MLAGEINIAHWWSIGRDHESRRETEEWAKEPEDWSTVRVARGVGRQDNGHVATNSSSSSSSFSFSLCTHDNTNRRWHMEQKIDTRPMRRDTSVTKVSQPPLDVPRSPRPGSRHQPAHGIFNLSLHEDRRCLSNGRRPFFFGGGPLRTRRRPRPSVRLLLRPRARPPSWPFFQFLPLSTFPFELCQGN